MPTQNDLAAQLAAARAEATRLRTALEQIGGPKMVVDPFAADTVPTCPTCDCVARHCDKMRICVGAIARHALAPPAPTFETLTSQASPLPTTGMASAEPAPSQGLDPVTVPRRPLSYRVRVCLHDWGFAQGWECKPLGEDLGVTHDHRCDDLTALVTDILEDRSLASPREPAAPFVCCAECKTETACVYSRDCNFCELAASEIPGFGTDRDKHRCPKFHRDKPRKPATPPPRETP